MEQKTVTPNIWIAAVVVCLVLLIGMSSINKAVSEDDMESMISSELAKLSIPTAEEIAAEIDVPQPVDITIPEFKSDNKVNDLWENLYSIVIESIENNATEDAEEELEDLMDEAYDEEGDLYEFLLSILNFEEVEDFDVEDVDVEVLELGLEEDEDKVAQVVFELNVEYYLSEGPINDVYEKTIIVTADLVYEEGDFDDEEVSLIFALV